MPSDVIPEGYMKNSVGHMVPLHKVSEVDKLRDELIVNLAHQANDINAILLSFKKEALDEISAFCQLSAEQHNKQIGGKKGNVQLTSYDGKYRIQRVVADVQTFDEQLQVAKDLIDEVSEEWTDGGPDDLKTVVDRFFRMNSNGNVNTQEIKLLFGMNVKHPKWIEAMGILRDSLTVIGQRSYVNVYQRVGDSTKYELISLALSGVE